MCCTVCESRGRAHGSLPSQVRKEYGKCLRTHCCSGKSVDSSIGSGKGNTSRTPGRYSTASQVHAKLSSLPVHCTDDSLVISELWHRGGTYELTHQSETSLHAAVEDYYNCNCYSYKFSD